MEQKKYSTIQYIKHIKYIYLYTFDNDFLIDSPYSKKKYKRAHISIKRIYAGNAHSVCPMRAPGTQSEKASKAIKLV